MNDKPIDYRCPRCGKTVEGSESDTLNCKDCLVEIKTAHESGIKYWKDWYYPSTGEHSEGWRDEWTPEEFRK